MTDAGLVNKAIADLYIQSMLFDMAIDWETLQLEPKSDYTAPAWLTRWKEKVENSDRPTTLGLEDVDHE